MNKFRLLKADEIECRISTVNENGLSLLLYKTARTDANLLDETVGSENWENDFKVVDGVLYGGIGIYDQNMDRWVWKWDAGTESNTEAEKGRASDAFKRAGFKHGIGRELYTAPHIWITPDKYTAKEGKNGKIVCYDNFRVVEIEYDSNSEISRLTIANDSRGVDVYTYPRRAQKQGKVESLKPGAKRQGEAENATQSKAKAPQEAPDGYLYCSNCGEMIKRIKVGGKVYEPGAVASRSLEKHGTQLCWECQKSREVQNS